MFFWFCYTMLKLYNAVIKYSSTLISIILVKKKWMKKIKEIQSLPSQSLLIK